MHWITVYLFVCVCGLSINGIYAKRDEQSVAQLLDKYPFNRFLFARAPKPFQVVIPKQMKKRSSEPISTREHKASYMGIHDHIPEVTFQIVLNKKKHKLKLTRNDGLLSAGIKVKYFKDYRSEVISKTVEHCYYHGTVKRDEWSAVAVSTCNGIRGVFQLHNETYIIQPLRGGDKGTEYPHIVYKATSSDREKCGNDHGKWLPFNELHKGEFMRKLKSLNAKRTFRPTEDTTDKYMKLALVLDNSMYWRLNLSVKHMEEYAIETANIVDMYYKELNIRMALTYIEMWNHGNRINVTRKLRETLENFLIFQNRHLRDVDHHAAHLLTKTHFEDNAVGMAIPDAICTKRAGGINKNPSYVEPQKGATILSHMIGHNLGILHDEDEKWRTMYHRGGCQCDDEFGCIMSTEVLATPEVHSRMFSSCSAADWDMSLNMGIAACLTENPQMYGGPWTSTEPTFSQVCGNKHVERGEECDCGNPEDCARVDPCCDPYTCLLKSWADCRSGACCHNCTYLTSDYLCRGRSSDCDVPEFCTGRDGQCPKNNYVRDGESCNNNTGYCMGGICPTLNQQCRYIWGGAAQQASLPCFERFNPTGNFNGHCGKDDRTGSYAKCLPDDIQCGLLHCSGGNKEPFYGPDKDSTKTTFSSNSQEYECKTVHGPSTMDLPNLGLVLDGTKCGDDRVCMKQQCVPLSTLSPLKCLGLTDDGQICSGKGVCTKDGTCFCDDGWTSPNCSEKSVVTRVTLSIDLLSLKTKPPPVTTDTVRVIPWDVTFSTGSPSTTDSSAAMMQVSDSSLINTKWMMIILAAVIGGLALILGLSFICYRRRSPMKFGKDKKKKKRLGHCEEGEAEGNNKLIKFGSLPSYKKEKKKNKGKKNKKGKKGRKSETDSDLGELPPPPMIISDPNSAKPEKGILKGSFNGVKYANDRRSSESNTATSDGNFDQDSVGPYDEIDEDTEAGEIQDIFGANSDEPERNLDALDNMIESSSFDFMLPPPFSNIGLLNRSPSPPRKFTGYDIPLTNLGHSQRPNLWKSSLPSPPKSRVLRMRNLDELLQNIDRNTIDLSPSPDDPPVQISPSTSEDVRSSSTEDRQYPASSQDPQSPNSITSGSTCTALRPLLGSQWSKYILHRNNPDNGKEFDFDDMDSPLPHINIPPPMNPINIRSIFNYGQKGHNRDNNDTPLGSQNGECSSNNGTANSRNGYEKSSGYGSEHDPERFSIEDISRNQSRSGSTSPPNFSAVIRTGPNQIKLVPAGKFQSQNGGMGGYCYNPMDNDLHKLLDSVPRIDAGCYERSPIPSSSNITSGTSTLETLKDSLTDFSSSGLNSDTNTLVNSEYETMDKLSNKVGNSIYEPMDHFCHNDPYGHDDSLEVLENMNADEDVSNGNKCLSNNSEHLATNTLEMLKQSMPEFSNGHLPNPKPLCDVDQENKGSGPCIDRSLEEIPQHDNQRKRKGHGSHRPISLSLLRNEGSLDDGVEVGETDPLMGSNRYSAIEPMVPVDICEC